MELTDKSTSTYRKEDIPRNIFIEDFADKMASYCSQSLSMNA